MHIMNEDTIMEEREDFMLSPAGDSHPTLRTAHFLKPVANSMHVPIFQLTTSSSSSVFEPKELPLKIHLSGWSYSQQKWVYWVDQLKRKYESVWKKAGIFEAIMSTKWCYIIKDQNLLYGVVEKWCCETNTFVFSFGEATITLEDIMVLGGYPILGDPIFTALEDQEMREVEEKLIVARKGLYKSKQGKPITSIWMDFFIDKGGEIEHEAFLVTWLSIFVFPYNLVKSSLFPVAIRLARGNSIALAPAVLASLYKDLTLLNKTIVGLSKYPVGGGDVFPLEVSLESPFYLVQIWVWERFKNLQPQPMLINHGDPLLLRWRKVQAMKIDNVRLALDSAVDDFLWRPYVRYADKRGMFYPNGEFWVPYKKDLDKEMLSFVTCSRVSELVGFESIEQYLPHRVSMQFGMDQDVPSYVPRFNDSKSIAWANFCRPISDVNLYFPSRFFEADVTMRYVKWWRQSTLGRDDSVKNIVKQTKSDTSKKHRPLVGKFGKSGNVVDVHPRVPPHLVDSLGLVKFCEDGSKTKTRKADDMYDDAPSKHNTLVPYISVEKDLKDENGSKKAKVSSDRVCLSVTQGESKSYAMKNKVSLSSLEFDTLISSNVGIESSEYGNVNDINEESVRSFTLDMEFDLENRIQKLERVISKLNEARFGHKLVKVTFSCWSYFVEHGKIKVNEATPLLYIYH